MVEFLKAKGTSFVNKPVGVNNVNTGAVEAGQTLARVGQQLATQFFADAEQEQIKLGKEVGLTLPVRDNDGNLAFQTTPTTLSDVAKNAAEPICGIWYFGVAICLLWAFTQVECLRLSTLTGIC